MLCQGAPCAGEASQAAPTVLEREQVPPTESPVSPACDRADMDAAPEKELASLEGCAPPASSIPCHARDKQREQHEQPSMPSTPVKRLMSEANSPACRTPQSGSCAVGSSEEILVLSSGSGASSSSGGVPKASHVCNTLLISRLDVLCPDVLFFFFRLRRRIR